MSVCKAEKKEVSSLGRLGYALLLKARIKVKHREALFWGEAYIILTCIFLHSYGSGSLVGIERKIKYIRKIIYLILFSVMHSLMLSISFCGCECFALEEQMSHTEVWEALPHVTEAWHPIRDAANSYHQGVKETGLVLKSPLYSPRAQLWVHEAGELGVLRLF